MTKIKWKNKLSQLKKHQLFKKWPLFFSIIVLALLLFRNPFSTRTLIPNLEPWPDTFHYLSPARCLAEGRGFFMCLPNQIGRKQNVPPVYSLLLTPILVINNDVRWFYLLNVLLSLSSLTLLYLIIKKITNNQFINALALFIYTTTYVTYWLPSLVMAENLLVPIFLGLIYLLLVKPSLKPSLLAGTLAASAYGTKYAALGLTAGYAPLYLFKVFIEKRKKWLKLGTAFIFSLSLLYLAFGGWQTVQTVLRFFKPIVHQAGLTDGISTAEQTHTWYSSPENIIPSLKFYSKFILGEPLRILWDVRVLLPKFISLLAIAGLISGVFFKRHRFLSLSLIWLGIIQLIPVLPFYATDGRYAITLFPTLILGLAIVLAIFDEFITKKIKLGHLITLALVFILGGIYLYPKLALLKKQLAVNLKYAETPWIYLTTQEMNSYFASHEFEQTPYLITLTSPYYLDYFGNHTYQTLPLGKWQDFRKESDLVWGVPRDVELIEIYQQKLSAGHPVFVTNYGTNAAAHFEHDYDIIFDTFDLELIQEGCYQQCNLYQLHLAAETLE